MPCSASEAFASARAWSTLPQPILPVAGVNLVVLPPLDRSIWLSLRRPVTSSRAFSSEPAKWSYFSISRFSGPRLCPLRCPSSPLGVAFFIGSRAGLGRFSTITGCSSGCPVTTGVWCHPPRSTRSRHPPACGKACSGNASNVAPARAATEGCLNIVLLLRSPILCAPLAREQRSVRRRDGSGRTTLAADATGRGLGRRCGHHGGDLVGRERGQDDGAADERCSSGFLAGEKPCPQRSKHDLEEAEQGDLRREERATREDEKHARQPELEHAEECQQCDIAQRRIEWKCERQGNQARKSAAEHDRWNEVELRRARPQDDDVDRRGHWDHERDRHPEEVLFER